MKIVQLIGSEPRGRCVVTISQGRPGPWAPWVYDVTVVRDDGVRLLELEDQPHLALATQRGRDVADRDAIRDAPTRGAA